MKGFFIMKPDMLSDFKSVDYFLKKLGEKDGIKFINFMKIQSWCDLSMKLYESNVENLIEKNIQMISTILMYKEIFEKDTAIAVSIDFSPKKISLQELYFIKRMIREKFAYNKKKYYIKINNLNSINFNQKLSKIDLNNIEYTILNENNMKENYYSIYRFAYLNYIHFSDPYKLCVLRDNYIIKKYLKY